MSVTGWGDAAGNNQVTLTVEIGFSSSTGTYGLWGSALWGTGTWGPDIVWTDVTEYVQRISTRWGRSRATNQAEAGTCTLDLRNDDARFSPWNLSGPYVSGGVTGVRAWRPVRISVSRPNIGIPPATSVGYLFYGYATTWREDYPMSGAQNIMRVECVDEFGRLARVNNFAQSPQGDGERTDQRVQRILANAGFRGTLDASTGNTTCQATTLAQNALTELKLVADSEGGFIDCIPAAEPTIRFRSRTTIFSAPPTVTLSDLSDTTAGRVKYESVQQEYSGDLVYTIVGMGRAGGVVQQVSDETSRALYGDLKYVRTDLVSETDAQCLGLASMWLSRYKEPRQRVTQVTIHPRKGPHPSNSGNNAWAVVLSTFERRFFVHVTPKGMGTPVVSDLYRIGASHEVTPTDWVSTLQFAPSSEIIEPLHSWNFAVWDTATWYF